MTAMKPLLFAVCTAGAILLPAWEVAAGTSPPASDEVVECYGDCNLGAECARDSDRGSHEMMECYGDCNGDRVVTIDEIIRIVNILLGFRPISDCPLPELPLIPTIVDVSLAVHAALYGCPGVPSTNSS